MATDLTERLMPLLNFTLDDLETNRGGRLSARQIDRLRRLRRRSIWIGIGIILSVSFVAALALYFGQRNAAPILTFIGVAITVCNAAIAGVLLRNWLRLSADIDSGEVLVRAGTLRHTVRVTGRVANYIVTLDDEEFSVAKPVFLAMKNGGRYRFYRTSAARILLAAEAL